ncbi:MAG: P22 phage major capsid protein family protein [Desulfomicrobium sp.]|nr:P22 phage major capsid protein family protein [Desulfomicrobium sp.]
MSNTLTALAPQLYSAAQEVAAEPFGAVDAIYTSFDDKGVAIGDTVDVPVAPVAALDDFTPGAATPQGANKTAANVEVAITASKKTNWHLTGEQIRSLQNAGNQNEWARQLVAQGMRALRNAAEADLCVEIKENACRAVGAAGTAPFADSIDIIADLRKELRDNGAPMADQHLVIGTAAAANLLKLGIVQQAYAAGSDTERRSGRFLPQYGFNIVESAGLVGHTAGDGTGMKVHANTNAGIKTFKVKNAGSGGVKKGDVLGIGDAMYVSHVTQAEIKNKDLVIATPGLVANATAEDDITAAGNYSPNFAFERNAIVGIMRPPLVPANPTINQMVISDNKGMSYLLLEIAQYGQITWELHLAWGFRVVQPEFVMTLLG